MNPDIRAYMYQHYGTGYMPYSHYYPIPPQWGNWNNDWNNHNNNNWNNSGHHYGNNDWNNHHMGYGYSVPLSLYHHYHPHYHPHYNHGEGPIFAVPMGAPVR